jgi:hypothetical protein
MLNRKRERHDSSRQAIIADFQQLDRLYYSGAGFGHGRDLGVIDEGSRAAIRIRTFVVNIYFVANRGAGFLRIGAADKDTAVSIGIDSELGYRVRASRLRTSTGWSK